MATKIVSTKSTGGSGEIFETHVCVFYMAHLLTEILPFSFRLGTISRIDLQVRGDRWFFDDLLITMENESGRVACNIKSSQIFGQRTIPKDIIKIAWEQFLHKDSTVFDRNKDNLLICTDTLPPKIHTLLYQLLQMASVVRPEQLETRISTADGNFSKELINLYEQFRCPKELCNCVNRNKPLTGELLSRLKVREFDFQHSDSRDIRNGINICEQVLKDRSECAGRKLWDRLIAIVLERKPLGGGIDRSELLGELKSNFEFCDHPDFDPDWNLLRENCAFALDTIQDTIGGSYHIPRKEEIESINSFFAENDILILSGPSGSGKSAIAKKWVKTKIDFAEIIWASASTLERISPRTWGENVSLSHSLHDVLNNSPECERYVVFDGIEQVVSSNQQDNLRFLLSVLEESSGPRWKILITCQPEGLSRIMHIFLGTQWVSSKRKIMPLNPTPDKELDQLLSKFTSLNRLSFRPEFRPILCNLKLLDLMAKGFMVGELDPSHWASESDFLNWYWKTVVMKGDTGLARSRFLQKIAACQADNASVNTSLSDIDDHNLGLVEELKKDEVIEVRDERIWFSHDIQADWARTRLLLSKGKNFIEFVASRLHLPMWSKAIRLHALGLIEKNDDLTAFNAIWQAAQVQNLQSLCDFLIEGVLFAGNPENAMNRIEPILSQNEASVLRRLLKRFEFLLTIPDPTYKLLIPDDEHDDLDVYLSSTQRTPLVAQWLPILRWIIGHSDKCLKYAPTEVASIANMWLSKMPVYLSNQAPFPCRKGLGKIVLSLAEDLNRSSWSDKYYFRNEKSSEIIYRAALCAANEHPERVREFVLVACRRKPPSDLIEEKLQDENLPENPVKMRWSTLGTIGFENRITPDPWSDGPVKQVDGPFRKACLETAALQPLMTLQPELCIEILLALIIEEPTPRERYDYDPFDFERLNFHFSFDFYPPLWIRGPFFTFFNISSSYAIKFLCKLVDFATERTFAYQLREGEKPFSISISFEDGIHEYLGGPNLFLWFRDQSHVPDILVSALMAFEQWLYMMIDQKEDVSDYLKKALVQTKSTAIVGVALEVGKKTPELFTSVLKPFLASEYLYDWDTQRLEGFEGHQMMGWGLKSKQLAKLAEKFHGLPHRKLPFTTIALNYFLEDELMAYFFEEARKKWQNQSKKYPDDPHLENLCLWFDRNNWNEVDTPDGNTAFVFLAPESVVIKRKPTIKENQAELALSTAPFKLQKLLEERRELSDSEADKLWKSIDYFKEKLTVEDAEGLTKKQDVECGIAAVLVVCASKWLKKNPEVSVWCQKTMANSCKNPQPPTKFDVPSAVLLPRWDYFCSIAYPFLWEQDVASRAHREIIALLASTYHDRAVCLLCSSVKNQRKKWGDSFIQFVNLVIQLGPWRCGNKGFEPPSSLQEYKLSIIEDFVVGKASKVQVNLMELEERSRQMHKAEGKRMDGWFPLLDLPTLKSALSCLMLDHQGKPVYDFESALIALQSGLEISIERLNLKTNKDDSGRPKRTIPYEFDHWIFREIAFSLPHIPVSKGRDDLWKNILALGPNEEHFVQDFLIEYFAMNLEKTEHRRIFVEIWKSMIDYALSCKSWDLAKPFAWYNAPVLFGHLIGGHPKLRNIWNKEYRSLINSMRPSINKVLEHCGESVALDVFLTSLLSQPAFWGILDIGLRHIRQSLDKDPSRFWNKHGLTDLLAEMLETLYRERIFEIKQSRDVFDSYYWLLSKLAERHNPVAQELISRLAMPH
jgi:hypothetical protein